MERRPLARAHLSQSSNCYIDARIEERLAAHGLQMSPRADRHTLIRRLYLVMLGVPPAEQEIDTFVLDDAVFEQAWPRLVDRVLNDPRYGERWAQHWLDVIRWAETVGFETNAPRPNAWRYRDWVIDAFNDDKPYDQFLLEQLAGDTCSEDAALGFLVAGPANLPGQIGRDEEAMRGARQDELDEVIRTVSQAFFGLTIGCARCHDHKFDPITSRDYYSMQAIFAGLSYGDRRLRGPENDAWAMRVPSLEEKLRGLEKDFESLRQTHGLRPPLRARETENFSPILARSVRMSIGATSNGQAASLYELEIYQADKNVALASNGSEATASSFALENQTRHPDCLNDGSVDQRQAFPWRSGENGPAWVRIDFSQPVHVDRVVWHRGFSSPTEYTIEVLPPDRDIWQEVAHTRDRLPAPDDTRSPASVDLPGLSDSEIEAVVTLNATIRNTSASLARHRAGPQVYAASFSQKPETTWLLKRGDVMQRTKEVVPAVPAFLGNLAFKDTDPEPARRLALARHLTEPGHPLTARVIANRLWQHHFGTGLVDTPSDLGEMGRPPSHPELLDDLALDLIDHEWSLKHLHRRILTSATFVQSSRPRAAALAIDADSRLLWRFPARRVEAEVIRDSILTVSGKLNPRQGGVGFDFFVQQGGLSDYQSHETFDHHGWRRMVYARKIRMQAVDIFGDFDCPDAGQMKPRRTRSITPLQSLGLMNSPFAVRQAEFFAQRLRAEIGSHDDTAAQVQRAVRQAFSREPTADEVQVLTKLAAEHGLEQACRVLFNTSEFIFLP